MKQVNETRQAIREMVICITYWIPRIAKDKREIWKMAAGIEKIQDKYLKPKTRTDDAKQEPFLHPALKKLLINLN